MDSEKAMELIYAYGKNGDTKIYDMLSSSSKEELSDIPVEKITESLQRFFLNKMISIGHPQKTAGPVGTHVFHLLNTNSSVIDVVTLIEENNEYKLLWNRKAHEENN